MNDVIKFGKKLFSASVVGVTIAWSMGLAAFVPVAAQAATCPELEAGDLFKATGASAVYYLTAGMERAYFPHVDVFNSWNLSFNDVVTVSGECLFAYPAATVAGINYRPGSRLVKLSDASPVFAVTPGNKLVQVTGESAAALYGTNWTSVLRDVSPFHWASYTDTRTTWSESKPHDGQFVKKTGETTVYWVKDGMLHQVDGSNVPDVRTVSAATFATLSMASGSVTVSSAYANPTQVDGSAPAPTTGALTVSVASNTSASKVVPMGAQGVEYLAFTVRAGSSAGTLEQVTLKRAGIGNRTDFAKVYLYHNGVRVDNGRALTTDNEVTFNVNKSISANSTETFWVKADMNLDSAGATSGDQNYFEITTASDVESTGTVGGSFPVRGNSITLGAQDIGSITVAGAGDSIATAKIGENDVLLSEFNVTATSTDDVELTSITLKQRGSAPASILSNITLMQGGTTLAEGVVTGDFIQFNFSQKYVVEEGDTKRFKVMADIGIGDTGDKIELILDETSDIMAFSVDFPGSQAGVDNNYGTSSSLEVTLEGGKINVDLEGTNEDVRVDQNDVVFGTFSILATAEDVDADEMKFVVVRPNSAACLEDLRLREKNGKGSYTLDYDGTCTLGTDPATTTAENMILTKGVTYEFEIVGDIASTALNADAYYFTWAASQVTAEGATSDNAISTNDFSSASLSGPTMTVNPSKLTVRQSALSNETVVNGTKNVLVYRGTLEAGSTSDIVVTSLTVAATSTNQAWDGVVDGLKLFMDGVQVSNDNTVTGEEAIFTGFTKTVKAGSANKVTFEVYADLTDGSTAEHVQVQVEDADASDEDSDTVNAVNSSDTVISSSPVVGSRIVTIASTGTLTAVLDSNYTGLRNDFYAIAGTQKQLAGRVQLKALYEDVELEDLVVFVSSSWSNTSTVEATFDTLNVYSDAAMTDLLGTAEVTRGAVTIEDVNFVVPADTTKYLYLGLNLNSVGTGDNGTATPSTSIFLMLQDSGTTANGVSSNDDVDPTVTATAGNDIIVAGAVVSNLATSFAGGNLAGGEQVFFTFAVTANSGANTDNSGDALDLYLTQLKLSIASDVTSVTSTKLCRVSTGNCINIFQATPVSSTVNNSVFQTTGETGYVDVTEFTNSDDERIDDGQTALFELRGTFSGVTDKYAQGSIQDVNNSGIVWGYDLGDDSVLDYVHTDLLQMEPRSSGYPDITGAALN